MAGEQNPRSKSPPQLPEATQQVFNSVIDELSANLQTFMDSIPAVTARYTAALEGVKRANPKTARRRKDSRVLSPLLRCRTPPGQSGEAGSAFAPPALPPPGLEGAQPAPADTSAEQVLARAKAALEEAGDSDPVAFFAKHFKQLKRSGGSGAVSDLPPPPSDPELARQTESLKLEAYELRVVLSGVCDWIEMQMPAIKLEDNRGVAVQEQVIRHLAAMRQAVQGVYDRERNHSEKLADYASKYYEHPKAAAQWGEAIMVWNEEHWDQLERDWREIRHIVVLAGRVLSLNMSTLLAPREHAGGFSGGAGFAYM